MRARRLVSPILAAALATVLLSCTGAGDGGRGGTEDFLQRGATVTPDTSSALERVFLHETSGDTQSTCITVEALRAFNVFNATFTVAYDPTVLSFTGFSDSGTCIGSGASVLPTLVDASVTPGEVVVGLSRNGANTTTGVNCGRFLDLCFDVIGEGTSRLSFTGNRELQDPDGQAITPLAWVGADVETRL